MELRPYQQEAVSAVYKYLADRPDNPCVVIPTAGGKTPVMAQICRDVVGRWGGRVMVLAHVKELLEQAVDKLHRLAPELTMHVGVYSAGIGARDTEHAIIVAGVQSVYKRACELGRFDLIIVDECFPAGTKVDGKAIETICSGDSVTSFNHQSGRVERRKVLAVSKRTHEALLVKLVLSNGVSVTCTPNHPFFVGDKYVPAASIEKDTVVFVRGVWSGDPSSDCESTEGISQNRADVLHEGVRVSAQRQEVLDTAAGQQSHETCRCEGAHVGQLQGASDTANDTRGKGARIDGAASVASGSPRRGMAGGTCHQDRTAQRQGQPDMVRRGPGLPRASALCGTRRGVACNSEMATVGQSQGQDIAPVRVDHVEILQRGINGEPGCGDQDYSVYNLQVEGNENYFANGVLVHNCHMIPADGEGMYRTFLSEALVVNPRLRLVGLTATPYRLTSGIICAPENLLNAVCYEVGVKELVVQGYISNVVSKAGRDKADTRNVHIRAGEFVASELEAAVDKDDVVQSAVAEIVELTTARTSVLIFAAGVTHARHVQAVFAGMGLECGLVTGDTNPLERAALLERFKARRLKYLVNVNVLTTGFDAPGIDCVAMLRPTMSPGLYYQMVGRGFRLCEGKENCLILDFSGNILRHGPVDMLEGRDRVKGDRGEAPAKECPNCKGLIAAGYARCPQCGYEFPLADKYVHEGEASTADVLSGANGCVEYTCEQVVYMAHEKKRDDGSASHTMRVQYWFGITRNVSEFVCVEHSGFALHKAHAWWRARSNAPTPETVADAVALAYAGALATPSAVVVRRKSGQKYPEIVEVRLGEKPAWGPEEEGRIQRVGQERVTAQEEVGELAGENPYEDSLAYGDGRDEQADDGIPF